MRLASILSGITRPGPGRRTGACGSIICCCRRRPATGWSMSASTATCGPGKNRRTTCRSGPISISRRHNDAWRKPKKRGRPYLFKVVSNIISRLESLPDRDFLNEKRIMKRIAIVGFVFVALTQSSWAQVPLNREDAMNFPSRHAWNLFMNVNHPAKDMKEGRGLPDLSKPIGAPGTTTVWETWRQATPEVFLENGAKPPAWDTLTPGRPPNA